MTKTTSKLLNGLCVSFITFLVVGGTYLLLVWIVAMAQQSEYGEACRKRGLIAYQDPWTVGVGNVTCEDPAK